MYGGHRDHLEVPKQAGRILDLVNKDRRRMVLGSFSACSASKGRSRETNTCFGNKRRKVEVLPVCLAPVRTTTGLVLRERRIQHAIYTM